MLERPDPVTADVAAEPDADGAALAAMFTPGVVVRDEAQQHRGASSLRTWRIDTAARAPFTPKPVAVAARDGTVVVATAITGAVPGGPLVLDHRFTVRDARTAARKTV